MMTPWTMVDEFAEDINILIDQVRKEQSNTNDPRSLAIVITHLEDALLRYQHAHR